MRTNKLIDEVGNRYARLTVIGRVFNGKPGAYWLCRCDCGEGVVVIGTDLRRLHTKSCGCYQQEQRELPEGRASFNQLHYQYRRNAVVRDYRWSLTKEYFEELTKQNCYYCGALPAQKYRQVNSNGWYIYNGIDRVDNSEGYVPSNVVPCCIKCNKMKGKLSENGFFEHLSKILKTYSDREVVNSASPSND